jgi:phospholipase/carboxylesterase
MTPSAPTQPQLGVLLLHGRGSSGETFSRIRNYFSHTDDILWLAPTANSNSWYPQRFLAPIQHNEPFLTDALHCIKEQVQIFQRQGIPLERIALIGFSQGACLAIEYAYRNPARYAFVASLSGALIGPLDTLRHNCDLQKTPVLMACAEHDSHIPIEFVEHSIQVLTQNNALVTRQIYNGGAHQIFESEIEWIQQQFHLLQ